jgi:hypothetical protein
MAMCEGHTAPGTHAGRGAVVQLCSYSAATVQLSATVQLHPAQ